MVDKELLEGFVTETHDLLDEVEPQLIDLTRSGNEIDVDTLNSVFRLFHSMKGSAGFLGLSAIAEVTHEAETLLDLIRKGKATLRTDHVRVFCRTVDCIRVLLEAVETSDSDAGHDEQAAAVIGELRSIIREIRGAPKSADATPSETADAKPDADGDDDTPEVEITPAMRAAFVQEQEELIDQAEQALLDIEKAEDSGSDACSESMTEAFRALHSLKGNCGFMGFPDIERLAHRMETALDRRRGGGVEPGSDMVSVLLNLLDVLREAGRSIADGGDGRIEHCEVYVELLEDSMPVVRLAEDDDPATPSAPTAASAGVSRAERNAMERSTTARIRQDIRVDISKLDALVNLVGELVIAEAMVTRHPHVADAEIESLDRAVHMLRRVSQDLQDVSMSARMIPLAATFRKMIRLVHDLSAKAGKQIELKLVGEETEVDKTVIEQIADPLVHIVRNAADHGIEPPEERAEAGKRPKGVITLEGRHEGGEVWIIIGDDGRGLDRERILETARASGLVEENTDEWFDERVFGLVFEPGFSTAETVTDVSGRGVGMDVVKKNMEKLNGKVHIRSTPGRGSSVILRIPLTLAIIEGMLVRVGEARYTVPMLAIKESFRPEASWITVTPDGRESVRIRDEFYPVLRLHERFDKRPDTTDLSEGILILVESDRQTVALFVDEILGQQETVIKGLSEFLGDSGGVSGCTILGDGQVSLILDIAGLVEEREETGNRLNETTEPQTAGAG